MLPFNAAAAVPDVASVLTGLSALAQCQSAAELQQKLVGWLAELGNCALVQLYLGFWGFSRHRLQFAL